MDDKMKTLQQELDSLAQLQIKTNQNLQVISYILEFLVEKLNVDQKELENYIDKRMKEYIEEVQKLLQKQSLEGVKN
jgi:riboflavin synthase